MTANRVWTESTLPFERLSPADFERLSGALLAAEGHTEIRHWGAAGSERGCDLVSVDAGGVDPTVKRFPDVPRLACDTRPGPCFLA